MNDPATTIPALSLTQQHRRVGWPSPEDGGPRIVFPNRQQSFRLSVVFSTVILRFCCRAAMDWPRAAFLLTMSLHSPGNQAARANCSLAILLFAPFSESEQLGSHDRTTTLTSKPVSPVIDICPLDCSERASEPAAPTALPISECAFIWESAVRTVRSPAFQMNRASEIAAGGIGSTLCQMA